MAALRAPLWGLSIRRRFLISTASADLAVLLAAIVPASLIDFGVGLPWLAEPRILPVIGIMVGSALLASWLSARMWSGHAPRPNYGRATVIVLGTLGLTSLSLTLTQLYFSRPIIGWTMVFWLSGALAHRAVRRRRPWTEDLVLVTAEKGLVDDLRFSTHANVIGVLDPGTEGEILPLEAGQILAVDLRSVLSDRMAQYVSSCTLAGLDVRPLTTVYEEHTGRLPIVHLAEGWELRTPVVKTAPYLPGKRLVETGMVIVTAPLSLLIAATIAIMVRFSSPGPVIFRQTRVGRNGQLFTLYKFRTMHDGAEETGPRFAATDDDRVTPVGRWLRPSHLDELPQLWNVLKGDLALVGPRPEQVAFAREFSRTIPFYSHRHLIRPGVTGWAQVNYGYADDQADTIEKLTYDLYYVKHMSPWMDLHILGRSIWTVLTGFGSR